jgi:hypothetical protein
MILRGSDGDVYHSEVLIFGCCPYCGIPNTRERNFVEAGSVSVLTQVRDTFSVGSVRKN